MDLLERAGDLKGMLVDFTLSGRFDRELAAAIEEAFPGGVVTDEAMFAMTIDHFALQHRLRSGGTVVEAFAAAHPEFSDAEREMLLGWQDVVEGMFEVTGKDRDAVVLVNLLDELTYRARSNMGARAFRPMKKDMILVGRLVPFAGDWLVSGNLAAFPVSVRDEMLAVAAQQALRTPEAVFRNPAKLAEARRMVAEHRAAFVGLFGADLIVVPGSEVAAKVDEFHRHLARQARPDAGPPRLAHMEFPDEIPDSGSVAIHFADGEGLSFYPDYGLLEELFADPALLSRRRYRETLSGFLYDPEGSPEPLRRLAARDPVRAGAVFGRFLKRKRGFSWEAEGEALLREHKPDYYDGMVLPRTVVLSSRLSKALQKAQAAASR